MKLAPPSALEAILFSANGPITRKRAASVLGLEEKDMGVVIEGLRESLHARGLALVEANEGIELRTSPEASDFVKKLRENELSRDLGRAGLETLAIVLYRGSATRGEIDWIRGVNSSATVRSLLLRGLIERTEDQTDKRRARYHVTAEALAHLGITTVEEAPEFSELSSAIRETEKTAQAAAEPTLT